MGLVLRRWQQVNLLVVDMPTSGEIIHKFLELNFSLLWYATMQLSLNLEPHIRR